MPESGIMNFNDLVTYNYVFRCGDPGDLDACTLARVHLFFANNHYDYFVDTATERYGEPLVSMERPRLMPESGTPAASVEHYWQDDNGYLLTESIGPLDAYATIAFGLPSEVSPIMQQVLRERGLD